jgi:hypothetical protein
MTAGFRWLRERLGLTSVPMPVLVAAGAAAVVIALAGRATTAQAAGLVSVPSQEAGVLLGKTPPVGPVRETVRALVPQALRPVVARLTASAGRVTTDPTVANVLDTAAGAATAAMGPAGGVLPHLAGSAAGPGAGHPAGVTPAPRPMPARPARGVFGAPSPSAKTSWPLHGTGRTPVIPGGPVPPLPGLPAAAISVVAGAVALASVAPAVAGGPWTLSLIGRHPPRSPTSVKQADLASLVERPG